MGLPSGGVGLILRAYGALGPVYAKGIMTALDFELTDVVTVFAMLLIATVLVRAERDNGLLALVRSTPAGRLHTAGAKLLALGASLAVVLACLYGVNLLYCGGLYGLGH